MARRYTVTIVYREPTFELRRGTGPRFHQGSFNAIADSETRAVEQALREFRLIQKLSWVGWTREVQSVSVVPADDESRNPRRVGIMNRVLVAYASAHEFTKGIAKEIGDRWRK